MTILARIKQTGEDGHESSEAVLEKYYEAKRELETLKQRVSSEYEDEIERLTSVKKGLEKKVRYGMYFSYKISSHASFSK